MFVFCPGKQTFALGSLIPNQKCWLNLTNKQQLFGSALLWTSGLLGSFQGQPDVCHMCCVVVQSPPSLSPESLAQEMVWVQSLSARREGGHCVTHMEVPEAEFSLGEAASAPQFNVQLPVSSSEPRAVGPSRESLKGRKVQSCTGSFAIPIQGAFKLLLYFNCFTWIKTADK